MIPVVLSGGSGTRLWPLSRQSKPKQFLSLAGERTMLQDTVSRISDYPGMRAPVVVCNDKHRFLVAEQLLELEQEHQGIILEPVARDTAPAITLAALHARANGLDEPMLVLPSDHVITNKAAFHTAIGRAATLAEQGRLVTFGVVCSRPETGYGYIKSGERIGAAGEGLEVERFVEKPDLATAETYVADGSYFWNGGMFVFTPSAFLKEMQAHAPAILQACELAYASAKTDLDFIRLSAELFGESPSLSIDYALMEKTANAAVVPLDAGWNDVGAYSALWDVLEKDEANNASRGDTLLNNCKDTLAVAESRLVCANGVEDLVIIETHDAVLVSTKDKAQDVKALVDALKAKKRSEALEHREGFRPWGVYDCIDKGSRFLVKRITVKPGQKLSLQMHHHRAEHWVVVTGTAKVRCGDKTTLLSENESTYIPLGELHQLSNPGKVDLELIEVQSGSYLGEDDIERFEDAYGRTDDQAGK